MRKYGLLGKTLNYSFSKRFFEEYFEKNDIDARFDNYEIPSMDSVDEVFAQNLSGLTVTIPYKEAIIPFLDSVSDEAKAIGAVNVIQFKHGQKVGHNTDAFGFHQSIKPFLTFHHERALILGTGGAAKAVAHVFRSLGIDVIYCSRIPQGRNQFSYSEINEHMLNACKVIVHCTPLGTFPNVDEYISIPFNHLTTEHLVIDLVYNPPKSELLTRAEKAGATILNGESMLRHQALRAFEIWNS
ncbi:MAG: shikimate dehydrogenase family protein [Flavobacteriia bacterium]|jgi:shikimate dehydrogenase|nr:shikimate dehydrogenase [Cryomorphaceae bacterium]